MKTIIEKWGVSPEEDARILAQAGEILRAGGLVAFPTETVYGLGGNALDAEAAGRIYAAKGRPSDNPLILHIADEEELLPLVKEIPENARRLMDEFWPGPMTLIFRKRDVVPDATTGGLPTAAIRMPSHPAARALIRAAGVPIAAPSANTSGRPSPTSAAHVAQDLSGRIERIIDGGDVAIGLESTIIDVTGEIPVILRPGYISREDVERCCGACDVDPAVLKKPEGDFRPKAPGMKYRHYAPKAEITIVEGESGKVAGAIRSLAGDAAASGKKTGILCVRETKPEYMPEAEEVLIKTIGSLGEEESIAHNLYRCLREFDEEGVEVVFSESFRTGELGEAVMNRLVKAAGYRVLKV